MKIKFIIVSMLLISIIIFGGIVSAQEPQYGGKLTVIPSGEIYNLDPYMGGGWQSRLAKENLYEPLMTLAYDGTFEPRIAKSWDVSEDKKTITFHLRKGIKFHNGELLEAKDVKYSLDRARNPETGAVSHGVLASIENVEVIDDYTVRVDLKYPDRLLLRQLYDAGLIMPADPNIDHLKNPIGSGPFKFKSHTAEGLVLEAFEDYYDENMPYIDELEFKFVADISLRKIQLQAGLADWVISLPLAFAEEIEADNNLKINYGENISGPVLNFLINLSDDSPVKDKRVRQAISYAIDRKKISDIAFNGKSIVQSTLVPKNSPGYNPNVKLYDRDVVKAKELLKEAGYPNGVDINLMYITISPEFETTALVMQSDAAEAGINFKLYGPEIPIFSKTLVAREFELVLSASYSLPGALENMWMDIGRMHAGYLGLEEAYPEFYNRLFSASRIVDAEEFEREIQELQEIAAEEQFMIVFGQVPVLNAMNKKVIGFNDHPSGCMYFRNVWIDKN